MRLWRKQNCSLTSATTGCASLRAELAGTFARRRQCRQCLQLAQNFTLMAAYSPSHLLIWSFLSAEKMKVSSKPSPSICRFPLLRCSHWCFLCWVRQSLSLEWSVTKRTTNGLKPQRVRTLFICGAAFRDFWTFRDFSWFSQQSSKKPKPKQKT